MIWFLGLLGGVVIGGLLWGTSGAMILGFLAWLAAMVYSSRKTSPPPVVPVPRATTAPPAGSHETRLTQLEATVAELKQRIAKLEGGEAAEALPLPWERAGERLDAPPPVPESSPVEAPEAVVPVVEEPVAMDVPPAPIVEERVEPPRSPTTPATRPLLDRLLEGNIVAKLGVVILFFGVAFLLKLAYDRGFFPPGFRLAAVAAASVVMFFLGWRLLRSHRTYALVLMGGAMGLLYLDVFFALKTFGFIGPVVGFALFAVLGVATLLLAVRLDARAFATLGLLGGFMAPVLASTGSGQHVILFSYYLLLNLVILATSWFRSWRELNFIGFLFTFAIALFWGHANYRPELFASVEPFLIAFFALYLAIPILFAYRQPPQLRGIVDGTLIFGVPLTAAMMQAGLTRGMGDHVLAWSAAIVSLVYAALAAVLWRRANMRLLAEAHLALAVVFGTVAPYFAFEGVPTFAFWTLEGAAIYWIGCRQGRVLPRAFALALQFVAAGYFWWVTRHHVAENVFWNERVVGCLLIAGASYATAGFMHRYSGTISDLERKLEGWVIAWAGAWLLVGAWLWASAQWRGITDGVAAMLAVVAVLLAVTEYAGRTMAWPRLRMTSLAGVPLLFAAAVAWFGWRTTTHPLQGAGMWAWPLVFAVHFHVVHRQLRDGLELGRTIRYRAAWGLLLLLATWEAAWRYRHAQFDAVVAIGAVGIVAAGLRYHLRERGLESRARGSTWVLAWALIAWFAGFLGIVGQELPRAHHPAADLALVAGSVLLFEWAGRNFAWPALRATQVLLPVALLLMALAVWLRRSHPFAEYQALAWIAAFAVGYFALRRQERDGVAVAPALQHAVFFAAIAVLLAWEAHWRVDRAGLSLAWRFAAVGMVLAASFAVLLEGLKRGFWPFADQAAMFRTAIVPGMLVLALAWTIAANIGSDGSAAPMRYVPVFNALDLAQLAVLAAAITPVRSNGTLWPRVFAVAGFFWLNAMLLRTVHHWGDVPFQLEALLRSVVAQASLSLLWTATALVMMFVAGRRGSRPLWMAGAALLGVVVVKLFVNDLGNTGTVARIVSFIGVGVFMLLIGYLSPVPPRAAGKR